MNDRRKIAKRVIAFLQAVSPACVGVVLGGPTIGVIWPAAPGLALAAFNRPQWGFNVVVILEMAALYKHGWLAFLFLAGLWLSWRVYGYEHLAAAALFIAAAVLARSDAPVMLAGGLAAGGVLVAIGLGIGLARVRGGAL